MAIDNGVSPHGGGEQASEGDAEDDGGEGLEGMLDEQLGTEVSTSSVGASASSSSDGASAPAPEPVDAAAPPEGDLAPPPPPSEGD